MPYATSSNTEMAFTAQDSIQSWTTATHTALVSAPEPAFEELAGDLIAGERLTDRERAGCVLIPSDMLRAESGPATRQTVLHLHRGKETRT